MEQKGIKAIKVDCKRKPKPPSEGRNVSTKNNEPQYVEPIPYEFFLCAVSTSQSGSGDVDNPTNNIT